MYLVNQTICRLHALSTYYYYILLWLCKFIFHCAKFCQVHRNAFCYTLSNPLFLDMHRLTVPFPIFISNCWKLMKCIMLNFWNFITVFSCTCPFLMNATYAYFLWSNHYCQYMEPLSNIYICKYMSLYEPIEWQNRSILN